MTIMRKLIFDKIARVVMVAMMATVCMTFMTACGGGDDDPLDNPNPVNNNTNNGGNNNSGGNNGATAGDAVWYAPLINWKATQQQVKDYTSIAYPELVYNQLPEMNWAFSYTNPDNTYLIYYYFNDGTMNLNMAYYYGKQYTAEFFLGKVKDICGKMPVEIERIEEGVTYEVTANGIHATVVAYKNDQYIVSFSRD